MHLQVLTSSALQYVHLPPAQIGQILDRSNISIQAAKIQTLGERVEDVFFLTNSEGNRLNDDARCDDLRIELCEALDKDIAA